jgi:hypothetical protein
MENLWLQVPTQEKCGKRKKLLMSAVGFTNCRKVKVKETSAVIEFGLCIRKVLLL